MNSREIQVIGKAMPLKFIINANRAVTFIEIIMAICLMALGLIPLFTIFGTTASDVSITIDEMFATNYANELMEAIMARHFDEIPENVSGDLESIGGLFFQSILKNISPLNEKFKRHIEIVTEKHDDVLPNEIPSFQKELIEKMGRFKIIKVVIGYSQNGVAKELKLGTLMTYVQ